MFHKGMARFCYLLCRLNRNYIYIDSHPLPKFRVSIESDQLGRISIKDIDLTSCGPFY